MSFVYAIATMDTKGQELAYVADRLRTAGVAVRTVDVGTLTHPNVCPDIPSSELLSADPGALADTDRGTAATTMATALSKYLKCRHAAGEVAGVIGIGGSGGTAIATRAMRALPIGTPKLMVSTMASGNTSPYVDCSDITMMYSVVDIAGLNAVSRRILENAAHAMIGMVAHQTADSTNKPTLAMTMFGVTTPCVTAIREQFESQGFDCLVFHSTGSGGRAMEKLVDSGMIRGVLDITTTEVADEVVGGVLSAGPRRLDKLIERQIPLLLSLGALDMVNFGTLDSVPTKFKDRLLHVHNAQVTLMRTSVDENLAIANWIATKINRSVAPVRILIPQQGVSALDAPGQPFRDDVADAALFDELERRVVSSAARQVVRLPYHINDVEFSDAVVSHFGEIYGG